MKSTAPLNLHLFIIVLGIAFQLAARSLAAPVTNSLTALAITLVTLIFTLGYAVQVSYRRGYEAASEQERSANGN